jgi:hypothetical protein
MGVVAPRPLFFGDAASEEGGVVGEVFSLEAEGFAERMVRGPGVIAGTGSINPVRMRGLSFGGA